MFLRNHLEGHLVLRNKRINPNLFCGVLDFNFNTVVRRPCTYVPYYSLVTVQYFCNTTEEIVDSSCTLHVLFLKSIDNEFKTITTISPC
jgi:hypothetical protein